MNFEEEWEERQKLIALTLKRAFRRNAKLMGLSTGKPDPWLGDGVPETWINDAAARVMVALAKFDVALEKADNDDFRIPE